MSNHKERSEELYLELNSEPIPSRQAIDDWIALKSHIRVAYIEANIRKNVIDFCSGRLEEYNEEII